MSSAPIVVPSDDMASLVVMGETFHVNENQEAMMSLYFEWNNLGRPDGRVGKGVLSILAYLLLLIFVDMRLHQLSSIC